METVKEFFQSIYDNYTDRIKNPFIGSFMISFIIFNWRAFAIIFFSEWPMHCRIEWIESKYCNLSNLLYPIGISFVYILVLPYFNLLIEYVLKYYNTEKQKKADDLETARLLKRKENAKILRQIADEKAGTSEIINLQTKIESLQKENNDLVEQNKVETKRWNDRNSASIEKEKELINLVDGLTQEKNYLENSINEINRNTKSKSERDYFNLQDPDSAKHILNTVNKLNKNDISSLIKIYGNNKIDIVTELSKDNTQFYSRLQQLDLVTKNSNYARLTMFGKYVVNFLENEYLDS